MKRHREREGRKEGGNSCKDIFVADWSKGMCINSFRCIFLSMLSVFTPCSNWSCLKLARTKSSHGKYASLTQTLCRLTGAHSATCVCDGSRAVLSHSLLLQCPGPAQPWPCPGVHRPGGFPTGQQQGRAGTSAGPGSAGIKGCVSLPGRPVHTAEAEDA